MELYNGTIVLFPFPAPLRTREAQPKGCRDFCRFESPKSQNLCPFFADLRGPEAKLCLDFADF
jgi:hypothetical protein